MYLDHRIQWFWLLRNKPQSVTFQMRPTPCISSKWPKNSMQFTLGMPFLGVLGKFYRNRKGLKEMCFHEYKWKCPTSSSISESWNMQLISIHFTIHRERRVQSQNFMSFKVLHIYSQHVLLLTCQLVDVFQPWSYTHTNDIYIYIYIYIYLVFIFIPHDVTERHNQGCNELNLRIYW